MDNNFSRRDFGRLVVAAAATELLSRLPVPAFAQNAPAPAIAIGAWEVPSPGYALSNGEKPKPTSVFGRIKKGAQAGLEAAKQTAGMEHFADLYLRVGNFYIHGLPVDPTTGGLRDFNDLKDTKLRIVVLTKEQHDAAYGQLKEGWKKEYTALAEKPPEKATSMTVEQALPKILDMAAAINAQKLAYLPTTLDRSQIPVNGNAAVAGLLSGVGVCPPDKCSDLETLFQGYMVPGVTRGFAKDGGFQTSTTYQDAAKAGIAPEPLVAMFKAQYDLAPVPVRTQKIPDNGAKKQPRP